MVYFNILTNFTYVMIRGESHIDFRTQCAIITLACVGVGLGRGLSIMTFGNSEKLSNFKVDKLS